MDLTKRQETILKAVVDQFTCTAEPVGSKTLMQLLDFPVSSATIRNEMAVLEKNGLLEKTHTSSGRIPSQKGYRYYVEHLMETNLDKELENSLKELFRKRHYSAEEAVNAACSILSEMTNLTSVVMGPDQEELLLHVQMLPVNDRQAVAVIVTSGGHAENKLFRFEEPVSRKDLEVTTKLLNEHLKGTPLDQVVDRLQELKPLISAEAGRYETLFDAFVSAFMRFATRGSKVYGRANMLCQPEFSDIHRLEELMRILENESLFQGWMAQGTNEVVPIDSRNELIQIGECSVIRTSFSLSKNEKETGHLMVIGPNRMQYARIIAMLDSISEIIEEVFMPSEGGCECEEGKEDSRN